MDLTYYKISNSSKTVRGLAEALSFARAKADTTGKPVDVTGHGVQWTVWPSVVSR